MSPTLRIPLASYTGPQAPTPAFIQSSPSADSHLEKVVAAVTQAKRIVVVCGAGISVGAGIPDFRSTDGVFQTLKRDNPNLSSGKDLFSAEVFKSAETVQLFNTMIGNLAGQAATAQPTMFHQLLKTLDDRGKLLRVYTQNIDCLEEQAGLTYGIPSWKERQSRSLKGKGKAALPETVAGVTGLLTPPSARRFTVSPAGDSSSPAESRASSPSSTDPGVPTAGAPRCIPLHGHIKTMYCPRCSHTTSLAPFLDTLSAGGTIPCSSCHDLESTRRLVGKRERGVGNLRPSVVLYGEAHREGEVVGECVRRDLLGIQGTSWMNVLDDTAARKGKQKEVPSSLRSTKRKPDLLIVAGTSLKVPGIRSIVRQFSKAARSSTEASPKPSPSPSASLADNAGEQSPIRTIFVNMEFPAPARDWDGVFDTWLQGDVQSFAAAVKEDVDRLDGIARAKEEQKAARASKKAERDMQTGAPKKRKLDYESSPKTPKKRKLSQTKQWDPPILTPPSTNRRASISSPRARTSASHLPQEADAEQSPLQFKARSRVMSISSLLLSPLSTNPDFVIPPLRSPSASTSTSGNSPPANFTIEVPVYRRAEATTCSMRRMSTASLNADK